MTPLDLLPGEKPGAFVPGPGGTSKKIPIPVRYVVPLDVDLVERRPGPPRARAEFIDYPGDRGHGIAYGHRAVWPALHGLEAYDVSGIGVALEADGPIVAIWPSFDKRWRFEPGQHFGTEMWFADFAGPLSLTDAGRELVAQ